MEKEEVEKEKVEKYAVESLGVCECDTEKRKTKNDGKTETEKANE